MKKIVFLLITFSIYAEDIKFKSSNLPLFSGMTEEQIIADKKDVNKKTKMKETKKKLDKIKKSKEKKVELFVSESIKKTSNEKNILDKIERNSNKIYQKSIIDQGKTFSELKEKHEKERIKKIKKEKVLLKINKKKFNYKITYEEQKIENILNSFEIYISKRGNYYLDYSNKSEKYLDKIYGKSSNIKIEKKSFDNICNGVRSYIYKEEISAWRRKKQGNENIVITELGEEINFEETKFSLVYY
jgi:hypothetical protein